MVIASMLFPVSPANIFRSNQFSALESQAFYAEH